MVPNLVRLEGHAITVCDAMRRFAANYDPALKIRVAPLWAMRLVGLFNPRMRFVAHPPAYFGNHEDSFYAAETWKMLGRPTTTLVDFEGPAVLGRGGIT